MYIYYIFRHCVKIPTAKSYIDQISPGVAALTTTNDSIVFWFYSLEAKRFKKYTLDANMKIAYDEKARVHIDINKLSNGFYFNFAKQRWERKIYNNKIKMNEQRPHINTNTDSIEQYYNLCHIIDASATVKKLEMQCDELRNQVFVKLKINDDSYSFNENTLQLELDKKSVFPTGVILCKFTINRYKEYMGIYYDYRNNQQNVEQQIGIYFHKIDNRWQLKECSRPSKMYFNGSVCKLLNNSEDDEITNIDSRNVHRRNDEIFTNHTVRTELKNNNIDEMESHYLQLNTTYSTYINLSTNYKVYPLLDVNFYKNCTPSLYIVGKRNFNDSINENEDKNTGDSYKWQLQQIINRESVNVMISLNQNWCPILNEPLKIFNIKSDEITSVGTPFIVYKNYTFFMKDFCLKLYHKIMDIEVYVKNPQPIQGRSATNEDDIVDPKKVEDIQHILPHLRKYIINDTQLTKHELYATFSGNTLFDIYAETTLLIDYIKDIDTYSFYNNNTFPVVDDDFQIEKWSCVQTTEYPDTFTYISLVDMFGLESYSTSQLEIVAAK